VAIVSNCDGTAARILRVAAICQVGPGPGVAVETIVDSAVLGAAKPDPLIFHEALAATATTPERTVFVGDSHRFDVEGARQAGLHPVQLDPFDLYADHEHDRIASLSELADHLAGIPAGAPGRMAQGPTPRSSGS
jgi:putative hydrolase of the HAD superfamily